MPSTFRQDVIDIRERLNALENHHHDSLYVAKESALVAWCNFDGTLTGTNAPTDGEGVSTIQRISAGLYEITLSSAMANTTYTVTATPAWASSGQGFIAYEHIPGTNRTTTVFRIKSSTASVDADCDSMNIMVKGDV